MTLWDVGGPIESTRSTIARRFSFGLPRLHFVFCPGVLCIAIVRLAILRIRGEHTAVCLQDPDDA